MVRLKSSKGVEQALSIPSITVKQGSNMVQMREAAVRLQADVLLIFSIQSDIYQTLSA